MLAARAAAPSTAFRIVVAAAPALARGYAAAPAPPAANAGNAISNAKNASNANTANNANVKPPVALFGVGGTYATALVRPLAAFPFPSAPA